MRTLVNNNVRCNSFAETGAHIVCGCGLSNLPRTGFEDSSTEDYQGFWKRNRTEARTWESILTP